MEALRELIAVGPWLRWLARLTYLSIAVGLLAGARHIAATGQIPRVFRLPFVVIPAVGSIAVVLALRRYAAASKRLRADDREYPRALAAQAAYFRRIGVVFALVVGADALSTLISFIAAVAR